MVRVAEALLSLALAAMVAMVFGNVVLRYGFDSGIMASEELSRLLFVWITFGGAVLAMRERGHLGFDLLARALPAPGRRLCRILSAFAVLGCCAVLLRGALAQTGLNMVNSAPVSGLPLGLAHAALVVAAIGIGAFALRDLVAGLAGRPAAEPTPEA
jgi:TRAP-type C4-dicarboxylate transport system permease small subunit